MVIPIPSRHPEVMNIRQCADYLGLSPDTVYKYANDGLIPGFKFGNRWRFKRNLLDAWMDKKSGVQNLDHSQRDKP